MTRLGFAYDVIGLCMSWTWAGMAFILLQVGASGPWLLASLCAVFVLGFTFAWRLDRKLQRLWSILET